MAERHGWTKYKIKRAIRTLILDGEPLTFERVETLYPGLYRAAIGRETFGSWQAAIEASKVRAAELDLDATFAHSIASERD